MWIEERVVAGVPVLLRSPEGVPPRGLVVLWHGFGPPGSEQALMDALPLDDVAAVKAYAALPLFGARMPAGGRAELGRRQTEDYLLQLFQPVVEGAVEELASLVEGLAGTAATPVDDGIGLFGFSAGGAAALYALMERTVPVRAAVVCNAPVSAGQAVGAVERALKVPYAWTPEAATVAARHDGVARAGEIGADPAPALLLLQSGADEHFGTGPVSALRATLRPRYEERSREDRLALRVLAGAVHHFGAPPASDPALLRAETSAWFRRWLTAEV